MPVSARLTRERALLHGAIYISRSGCGKPRMLAAVPEDQRPEFHDAAMRHGSFRKAADALGLKQSNLSRRIRDLEDKLGMKLFERTNGGVRPTRAGRDFLHGAHHIPDQIQALIGAANTVRRGDRGRLAVGFYTSLSADNLRATLLEYPDRFLQVEISTVEDGRAHLF